MPVAASRVLWARITSSDGASRPAARTHSSHVRARVAWPPVTSARAASTRSVLPPLTASTRALAANSAPVSPASVSRSRTGSASIEYAAPPAVARRPSGSATCRSITRWTAQNPEGHTTSRCPSSSSTWWHVGTLAVEQRLAGVGTEPGRPRRCRQVVDELQGQDRVRVRGEDLDPLGAADHVGEPGAPHEVVVEEHALVGEPVEEVDGGRRLDRRPVGIGVAGRVAEQGGDPVDRRTDPTQVERHGVAAADRGPGRRPTLVVVVDEGDTEGAATLELGEARAGRRPRSRSGSGRRALLAARAPSHSRTGAASTADWRIRLR